MKAKFTTFLLMITSFAGVAHTAPVAPDGYKWQWNGKYSCEIYDETAGPQDVELGTTGATWGSRSATLKLTEYRRLQIYSEGKPEPIYVIRVEWLDPNDDTQILKQISSTTPDTDVPLSASFDDGRQQLKVECRRMLRLIKIEEPAQ